MKRFEEHLSAINDFATTTRLQSLNLVHKGRGLFPTLASIVINIFT